VYAWELARFGKTTKSIENAIRYVEENPEREEGMNRQLWHRPCFLSRDSGGRVLSRDSGGRV